MITRMTRIQSQRCARGATLIGLAIFVVACASTRPQEWSIPTKPQVLPGAKASGASIGLVLTGGGAFGAWEVGALQALFDAWWEKYGEDPPIVIVAGASTGALIAPFVLFRRAGLAQARNWYTSVSQGDIVEPKLGALLPFPLFAISTSSIYGVGYSNQPNNASRLYGKLLEAFPQARLKQITSMWPDRRLVVTTLDFCTGRPDPVTNSPNDSLKLREAILASAMAPLALPPIPLPSAGSERCPALTPHLDGGVYSMAPFNALFDVAFRERALHLTHVIVVSAFPMFPSDDKDPVQDHQFPPNPKFKAIGDRMNVLLSEAGASATIRLARAAIALRKAGLDPAEVQALTGMRISTEPPQLIELMPTSRLGWEALDFCQRDMTLMYKRGQLEACHSLATQLGVSLPCTTP